ncbi:hypothetical protein Q1695_003102 [Nippostrongylus brasiliensis]|nr:hypothetical protein Q1695_003102 [Nippostrongylus brasiliensis]
MDHIHSSGWRVFHFYFVVAHFNNDTALTLNARNASTSHHCNINSSGRMQMGRLVVCMVDLLLPEGDMQKLRTLERLQERFLCMYWLSVIQLLKFTKR